MVDVRPCADEQEEQLSLDVYNAVWPHEAVSMEEVRHFKAAMVDHVDLVAWIDDEPAGSGFGAIQPQRPELVLVLLTVLAEARRRGAGTALYEATSDWARAHGLDVLEAVVSDEDPESLAFAERRGFVEDRREKGVALRLAEIEPPSVEPPEGIRSSRGRSGRTWHAASTRSLSRRHLTCRAGRTSSSSRSRTG